MPFRVRNRHFGPFTQLAKSWVFVVDAGVVDVDVNPQAVQPEVILAQHILVTAPSAAVCALKTSTPRRGRVRSLDRRRGRYRPAPGDLGEPGERRQLITWHSHRLALNGNILREHLTPSLAGVRLVILVGSRWWHQHTVEQRIVRRRCLRPAMRHFQ